MVGCKYRKDTPTLMAEYDAFLKRDEEPSPNKRRPTTAPAALDQTGGERKPSVKKSSAPRAPRAGSSRRASGPARAGRARRRRRIRRRASGRSGGGSCCRGCWRGDYARGAGGWDGAPRGRRARDGRATRAGRLTPSTPVWKPTSELGGLEPTLSRQEHCVGGRPKYDFHTGHHRRRVDRWRATRRLPTTPRSRARRTRSDWRRDRWLKLGQQRRSSGDVREQAEASAMLESATQGGYMFYNRLGAAGMYAAVGTACATSATGSRRKMRWRGRSRRGTAWTRRSLAV